MTTTPPAETGRRRVALLPLQVLYVVFLPVWLGLAIAATMGLANTDAWWAVPGILLTWAYPLVAVAAVVLAHVLWTRDTRRAHVVNALALPWVLLGVSLLLWIFSADFSFGP